MDCTPGGAKAFRGFLFLIFHLAPISLTSSPPQPQSLSWGGIHSPQLSLVKELLATSAPLLFVAITGSYGVSTAVQFEPFLKIINSNGIGVESARGKMMIEKQRGKLEVASHEGKGSTTLHNYAAGTMNSTFGDF